MQKKLIAVAIAGLASSGAFAQMNVTVYGQIDLSISQENGTSLQQMKDISGNTLAATTSQSGVGNTGATTTAAPSGSGGQRTAMRSGLYRGTYLGFKGTEDLGGGLKLDFVIEQDIDASGGTGQAAPAASTVSGQGLLGNNEASVALTTGVGKFTFGRQANFLASIIAAADPYFGKGPGGVEQMTIQPLAGTKASNSIRYDIKVDSIFAGYQIAMSENQDKVNSVGTAGSVGGGTINVLWAGYREGPALAILGYGIVRDYNSVLGINLGRKAVYNSLAGTYDFGAAKLHAMWTTVKSGNVGTRSATTGVDTDQVARIDGRTYMLGLTVPVGAHAFKVSYVNADDKRPFDLDGNSWGLGYEYDFSKRTKFYSRLARVSNSNGSAYGVLAGGGQITADSQAMRAAVGADNAFVINTAGSINRTNGITAGIQHSF